MKRMLASSGYTIVEAMIFLAVSGLLLVSVIALISGEQAKTEFTASIRDFESRMQDVLNDIATGSYPGSTAGCSLAADGSPQLSGSANQGTNQACTFVGKAIQFSPEPGQEGQYKLSTVVGRRIIDVPGGAPKEVSSIQDANPRILGGIPVDTSTLNSSLQFRKVLVNGEESYGFALTAAFGQTGDAGVIRGSAGTSMIAFQPTVPKFDSSFSSKVNNLNSQNAVTSDVIICVGDSGSGGRLGAVRLSGAGTEILFDNNATEAGC